MDLIWHGELGFVDCFVAHCSGYRGENASHFRWIHVHRGPAQENGGADSKYPIIFTALPGGRILPRRITDMIYDELEKKNKLGREAK